jgi:hypothetical protein
LALLRLTFKSYLETDRATQEDSIWIQDRGIPYDRVKGQSIEADKYAPITIIVDGFELPETIFVIDDYVEENQVEHGRIRLPQLVVGSGTMDKYGITLDPKEGVKLTGAALLL